MKVIKATPVLQTSNPMNRLIHWLITHPVGGRGAPEPSSRLAHDEAVVRVDVERMRGALKSDTYAVASGLSREEKRQKILAIASRQR